MKSAMADLRRDHLWVIYPGDRTYALTDKITALSLERITSAESGCNLNPPSELRPRSGIEGL